VTEPLLTVRGLAVSLADPAGARRLVEDLDLDVAAGSALGIVGESGSGKTMTLRALLGLAPRGVRVEGSVRFAGAELVGRTEKQLAAYRGRQIAMVFQDPMAALNPIRRVGAQVAEGPQLHLGLSRTAARRLAVEQLQRVGLPDPTRTARRYPHELSGGMRQRVLIAMALACRPRLVLCDEPTTALDVTVQAQVLRLLGRQCAELGAAMIFVSHDLTVIRQVCSHVAVMYAGRIVETGAVDDVFADPRHGYTASLLRSLPRLDRAERPHPIGGEPPNPRHPPAGCRFHPRCPYVTTGCPELPHRLVDVGGGHASACVYAPSGLPALPGGVLSGGGVR
jgi:oligopeptide/dipeptide ABC transporter ATP-binding protein